jgi:hypothetical protein
MSRSDIGALETSIVTPIPVPSRDSGRVAGLAERHGESHAADGQAGSIRPYDRHRGPQYRRETTLSAASSRERSRGADVAQCRRPKRRQESEIRRRTPRTSEWAKLVLGRLVAQRVSNEIFGGRKIDTGCRWDWSCHCCCSALVLSFTATDRRVVCYLSPVRSATRGSTPSARLAGMTHAIIEAKTIARTTKASVKGSVALVPNSSPRK